MKGKKNVQRLLAALLMTCMLVLGSFGALAADGSDDNSLAGLGISTEGATVSPEFAGSTYTYNVVVPQGTTSLDIDPIPSNANATVEVRGNEIGADGTATVIIAVTAVNGTEFDYQVNVSTAEGTAPAEATPAENTAAEEETEAPEPVTEKVTEKAPETEDPNYVRVEKNTIQEAENTIDRLKGEIETQQERITNFRNIIYGLVALSVVLLILVINLIIRRRDLKRELNDYRRLGYVPDKKAKKAAAKAGKEPAKALADAPADAWELDESSWDEPWDEGPKQTKKAAKVPEEAPAAAADSGKYVKKSKAVQPKKAAKDSMFSRAPRYEDEPKKAGGSVSGSTKLYTEEERRQINAAASAPKAAPQAPAQAAPQASPKAAPKTAAPKAAPESGRKSGGKNDDVEITMIDL